MSPADRQAWIVVDLGFGDAGKGTITDFLVRDRDVGLVVRFNGGAQAGHNVITPDGRHHTFSQFGSGSFVPGVQTLLGPDFLLHPWAMAVEARYLAEVGVGDCWSRTAVDARVRLITPYQQATNRVRETLRGAQAHGTCGVGIGECVVDALEHPEDTLRAGDLRSRDRLADRLSRQRARKRAEVDALPGAAGLPDRALFDDDDLIERVLAAWAEVAERLWILPPEASLVRIRQTDRVVFEGAQGLLLDEDWGFFPHTTWSDCTPAAALRLLAGDDRAVTRLGLTRGYTVRHGAGPLPTASSALQGRLCEPHNDDQGWQGAFRIGALDGVLLRYAVAVSRGLDGVVLTCLDRLPDPTPVCTHYDSDGGPIYALDPGQPADLAHREALGRRLSAVRPVLTTTRDVVSFVEQAVGLPVVLTSHGPRAGDKRWRVHPDTG